MHQDAVDGLDGWRLEELKALRRPWYDALVRARMRVDETEVGLLIYWMVLFV